MYTTALVLMGGSSRSGLHHAQFDDVADADSELIDGDHGTSAGIAAGMIAA